jgi:hypothetical protein
MIPERESDLLLINRQLVRTLITDEYDLDYGC